MNYVGIDIHKRYSVLCAQDEGGTKLKEARIEGQERQDYARFFQGLEGPSKTVLEACWNWGLTHDLKAGMLEELDEKHLLDSLDDEQRARLVAASPG